MIESLLSVHPNEIFISDIKNSDFKKDCGGL